MRIKQVLSRLVKMELCCGLTLMALVTSALSVVPIPPFALVWDNPNQTNVAYFGYYSTNLSLQISNWSLLFATTNPAVIDGGKHLSWTNTVLTPGQYYFTMTASNFWSGSQPSPFSAVVGTPAPLPLFTNLVVVPSP